MQNRSSRDRAAVAAKRVGVVGTLPLALAVAMSGVAVAAPTQAGTSTPSPTQGGTSTPAPTQEGTATPAPEPEPQEERQYLWTPPAEYQNIEYRELPTEQTTYVDQGQTAYVDNGQSDYVDEGQAVYVAPEESSPQLHLPVAVDPVKPIDAPDDMLRAGDFMVEQKVTGLSDELTEKLNNSFAVVEAQNATFWQSVGFEPDRADKVAAASVAGGLAGAAAVGVPAAALGGLVGVVPGVGIGNFVGPTVGAALVPGVGFVPGTVVGPVAGGAIGAGVGAAVLGVPAAAVGAVVGAGVGAATGAGDVEGGPTKDLTPMLIEAGWPEEVPEFTPPTLPTLPALELPAPPPLPALPELPALELPALELPAVPALPEVAIPVLELPEVTVDADLPSSAGVQVSGGGVGDGAATISTAVNDQSADVSAGTNWTSPDGAVSVSASGTSTLANFGITVPTGQITVNTPFGTQSIELPTVA